MDTLSADTRDTEEYVALCLSVKNQSLDLNEWLTHHYHHAMVNRFYIMDDGSNPPISEMPLPPGIPASAVTFQYFNSTSRVQYMQLHVYNQCILGHGHKHAWMGFIDADEFIQVKGNRTLKTLLQEFDKNSTVGALGMNWQFHTSNGLHNRPKSARRAFTTCILNPNPNHSINSGTENEHIKSIVKTRFYNRPMNPHKFYLKNGTYTVGENGDKITGKAWRFPITREKISLHHYGVKSKQEFEEKMNRGNGMDDPKKMKQWERIHSLPNEPCYEMAKYEP